MSRNRILAVVLFLTVLLAAGYRIINRTSTVEVSRTFPVLGTFATVIVTVDQTRSSILPGKADSLLNHLDTQLGRYSKSGQLFDLNTTFSIDANTELAGLIRISDTIVSATGNSFDPTLGALSEIWGFPQPETVPDPLLIQQALLFTGWDARVDINDDFITLEPGTVLDLGAIAKGHAVDRTYDLMMELGATECLVEVGGEVRCGSLTGRVWHVGVRHPRSERLAGILAITEGAVATSGDYECYFIEEGVRYSHLLDPETGFPSMNAASATVIADDCATADAMATAAVVAGPERAVDFHAEMYIGMLIITADRNDVCETHEFGDVPWGE
ncbi:MAG: FAD:protein FMN transferase [Candidatus Sabulitectum sp.]|nr:FAD:protein FMN transferase [Candidatus Sabulitectum sp.]